MSPTMGARAGPWVGHWRLEREIEDRYAAARLWMVGTLRITEEGTGSGSGSGSRSRSGAASGQDGALRWVEAGRLHRPGAGGSGGVEVGRRLRVVRRAEGWWVLFEDGRDFHPWTPGAWVDHPCGPDHYRGLVEGTRTEWRVTWQVSGPAKDYTILSVLRPADG